MRLRHPNHQGIGEISVFRIQERAHFPPTLSKFIYYLNKISEFCPRNLWAKSQKNFGTLEFRYFAKVVNRFLQNWWEMCPFLHRSWSFRNRRFIGAKMEAFLTVAWWLGCPQDCWAHCPACLWAPGMSTAQAPTNTNRVQDWTRGDASRDASHASGRTGSGHLVMQRAPVATLTMRSRHVDPRVTSRGPRGVCRVVFGPRQNFYALHIGRDVCVDLWGGDPMNKSERKLPLADNDI